MSSDLRETSMDKLVALNSEYYYYSLPLAAKQLGAIDRLPKSMKVLLENLLRHVDGDTVQVDDLKAIVAWLQTGHADREIAYRPARVLMQDFTGVPAVVDLAAMREAVRRLGGNVDQVNPLSPVDLVIDHSVTVDEFGDDNAFEDNVRIEMQRNHERYTFLRWGRKPSTASAWCRRAPASVTRSTSNTSAKRSGTATKAAAAWLIPIRWWAPIPTPP